jgi:serine/threonine protein kinase
MINQTLNNRYKITERLGKGAMGTVYRATDTQAGREVALKVISSELAIHPEMMERFKREGEALSKLKHPNIVEFLGAFEHEEHYVVVMEYIPGGNLHELINKGALSIDDANRIALELCDALIRSHYLNIVHRDLKPENVLIAEDGTPKLADFGVARLNEGTRLTRSGTQIGTPYYMAPEAWEGKSLDAQADIWSLGVVLFEMLTGQVPFGGDTGAAVMNKVLTTPPPDLKKMRAEVSPALSKIVRRMLTRDKKRRYQTMREVGVDLEREGDVKRTTWTKKPLGLDLQRASFAVLGVFIVAAVFWGIRSFVNRPQIKGESVISEFPPEVLDYGSTLTSDRDGMVSYYVPAGEFILGSDDGVAAEAPEHVIYLEAFWIDETEVTNEMYSRCVEDGVCDPPSSFSSFQRDDYYENSEYDDYPVINVNWQQADTYCSWADRRLPTEAEWEKAARGEDGNLYPWGNQPPTEGLLNFNDYFGDTTEVGIFAGGESVYGAEDMAGNVWEWTSTIFQRYPYDPDDGREELDADLPRVVRGGGWDDDDDNFFRSSFRKIYLPENALFDVGFRCAISESP